MHRTTESGHNKIAQHIALMIFALDKVHEAAFLIDEEARFSYVNDESCRALEYPREELLQLGVANVDPDFTIERWSGHWEEIKKHGSLTFEGRHRKKDGGIFPVEISANYFEFDGQVYDLALVRDITERKRVEDALRFIAQRGWAGTADSFLSALAGYLGDTLGMDYVLIDQLVNDENDMAETVALYAKGEILPNMRYKLKGTPCENVIGKKLCLYPKGVQALFPADTLLADMGAESYAGIPLWDSAGRPIGLLAALDGKPFHDESMLSHILQLAATSAAAALERKRSEEKLYQATEMWERTFNAVPDLIAIIDKELRILQANKAMADRLGCTPAECEGQFCYAAVHKMEAPPSYCPHAQTLKDGLEHMAEVSDESLGGDFLVTTSPIYDSASQLVGSVHVARDITERKKAVTELKESERRISESLGFNNCIMNTSPIGILTFNSDGQCTFVNESAAEMVGTTVSNLLRQNFNELESWRNSGLYHAACQALNEGSRQVEDVLHVVSTFGRDFWVNASFNTFHFGGERCLLLCMQDITERKCAETKLNEQFHFLQQLLDSIPVPVYYKDIDGLYLGCNASFEEFIGLSRNMIIGKTVYDVAPKELADTYHGSDMALFRNSGEQMYETSVKHADGTIHQVIFNKATYLDADGRIAGIVGAIMDITQRLEAEEERKNLEAQLHQAQKMEAVGQLAGGIAHDFNNILTAISGYSSMILARMENESPLRRYVELVLAAAGRAAELTNGLLAFSRRQVLNAKTIELCEVVQGLKEMLRRLVPEDIDFRTTVAEGDLIVMADKGQIEQVLMNLATNAKDAMPRGGALMIEVSHAVMEEQFIHAHGFGEPGDYACISVSDAGCGMDEETRKRIFEPFFTTKEVGKGTGLGMAIIYGIIKQHNGYISVYSERGKGTTFKIYLPLISDGVREERWAPESEPAPGGTETVLLAEDDEAVRELHMAILEEAGYRVIEAVDGGDALEKFTEHMAEVDILATDVIMPRMNGKILYEAIKKIRSDMKVLFMSGYTKDIIVERGIMDDECCVVTKPVTSRKLLTRIREILDSN